MSDTKPTMDEILYRLSNTIEWCVDTERLSSATVDSTREVNAVNEAKLALTAYIDDIVESVVGEDEKYLRGRKFYASEKTFKNAAIKIENDLRSDQRTRYQTIKQKRGL